MIEGEGDIVLTAILKTVKALNIPTYDKIQGLIRAGKFGEMYSASRTELGEAVFTAAAAPDAHSP